MSIEKNTIIFTLEHRGERHQVQTTRGKYHHLMSLISDHLAISGFGLCCGMGSCGTCLVQISNPYSPIKTMVLACDIQVNDELANTIISIPDAMY